VEFNIKLIASSSSRFDIATCDLIKSHLLLIFLKPCLWAHSWTMKPHPKKQDYNFQECGYYKAYLLRQCYFWNCPL